MRYPGGRRFMCISHVWFLLQEGAALLLLESALSSCQAKVPKARKRIRIEAISIDKS